MAETRQQVLFTYQDVAELLVKKQGIHDGFWGIYFEVGLTGAPPAPAAGTLGGAPIVPGVTVLINKIGILKFDQPNVLTVDAAKVNPATDSAAKT